MKIRMVSNDLMSQTKKCLKEKKKPKSIWFEVVNNDTFCEAL